MPFTVWCIVVVRHPHTPGEQLLTAVGGCHNQLPQGQKARGAAGLRGWQVVVVTYLVDTLLHRPVRKHVQLPTIKISLFFHIYSSLLHIVMFTYAQMHSMTNHGKRVLTHQ